MNQQLHLAWWQAQLGELRLAEVTPARVAACRDQLLQSHAPATVNRYLAVLSHACSVAVTEWGWLDTNPLRQVRGLRTRELIGRAQR